MVIREGLREKLTFEQRLEGDEGISHTETGEELPRRGVDQVQALRQGPAQHREVRMAGTKQ